jgi:predicted dehydrogenase
VQAAASRPELGKNGDPIGWSAGSTKKVAVIGLGTIAATHLNVMADRSDVAVAFGVDPRPSQLAGQYAFPQYASLAQGLASSPEPDLIVVATPTDTHVPLVAEALGSSSGLVLSEKPLTRAPSELVQLRRDFPDADARLRVAHHFAFSPEVRWAERTSRAWSALQAPRRILSVFNDPYTRMSVADRRSYVSSWVDSGPNQLSMLRRFVAGFEVVRHAEDVDGLRSATQLTYDGGDAYLISNWLTRDSSKQTTLSYADGSEIQLDHTSMTGVAVASSGAIEHFGNDGSIDRKVAHYMALYECLLGPASHDLIGLELAEETTALLAAATGADAQWDSVAWLAD